MEYRLGFGPQLEAELSASQFPLSLLFSSLLLSSLELSDTNVYEPYTRARLGTAVLLTPPAQLFCLSSTAHSAVVQYSKTKVKYYSTAKQNQYFKDKPKIN